MRKPSNLYLKYCRTFSKTHVSHWITAPLRWQHHINNSQNEEDNLCTLISLLFCFLRQTLLGLLISCCYFRALLFPPSDIIGSVGLLLLSCPSVSSVRYYWVCWSPVTFVPFCFLRQVTFVPFCFLRQVLLGLLVSCCYFRNPLFPPSDIIGSVGLLLLFPQASVSSVRYYWVCWSPVTFVPFCFLRQILLGLLVSCYFRALLFPPSGIIGSVGLLLLFPCSSVSSVEYNFACWSLVIYVPYFSSVRYHLLCLGPAGCGGPWPIGVVAPPAFDSQEIHSRSFFLLCFSVFCCFRIPLTFRLTTSFNCVCP